jgi:RHS repeat-associated protein
MKGNSEKKAYDYYAFGEILDEKTYGNLQGFYNRYKFTSREWDSESANYYYRARYYTPTIGRFTARDPIKYGGGLNLYGYVKNNPASIIDPTGEKMCASLAHLGGGQCQTVTYGGYRLYPICVPASAEDAADLVIRVWQDYAEDMALDFLLECPEGQLVCGRVSEGYCGFPGASLPCEEKSISVTVPCLKLTGTKQYDYRAKRVHCAAEASDPQTITVDSCSGEARV